MKFLVILVFPICAIVLTAIEPIACDEPGTPNQESAYPISPTSIRLFWHNTASEGGTYFDIEGQTDRSIGNFGPYNRGNLVSYDVHNLATNRQHCFRIWARVGANGCRSRLPSAWACATPLPTSAEQRVGGALPPFLPIGGERSLPPGSNPPRPGVVPPVR